VGVVFGREKRETLGGGCLVSGERERDASREWLPGPPEPRGGIRNVILQPKCFIIQQVSPSSSLLDKTASRLFISKVHLDFPYALFHGVL